MVRKAGKLPPPKETVEYGTEYSRDKLELAASCGVQGGNVLLVDDLIATGGSLLAAAEVRRDVLLLFEIFVCLVTF
jgi:adenine phosphoribosyltransferase